jgi:phosphate starvation-inducible protein PhoH
LVVDEATSDALRLFNARLGAQAENEKAERRVQKAAKAKDDAAGRVRNLENDTKATAEQRAEAAAAYRAAVDAWERARNGEADPAPSAAPAVDDATADDEPADADEPAADEPAAEAPAAEAAAEAESADEPDSAAPADH